LDLTGSVSGGTDLSDLHGTAWDVQAGDGLAGQMRG
jgi:hypothetical protein